MMINHEEFNRKHTNNQKKYVDICRSFLIKYNYGDIISHEDIITAIGFVKLHSGTRREINDNDFEYLAITDTIKNIMLFKFDILVINVRGIGYRIVSPHEQPNETMALMVNNILSEINKANKRLTHIRLNEITYSTKSILDKNSQTIEELKRQVLEL